MPIEKNAKRTDAQRRARNKYQAKAESTLACKLKRDTGDAFKEYARMQNTTVSALLSQFVKDTLDAAGMLPDPKAPADPVQDDGAGDQ